MYNLGFRLLLYEAGTWQTDMCDVIVARYLAVQTILSPSKKKKKSYPEKISEGLWISKQRKKENLKKKN